jgi:hypothetical protein
MMALQILPSSFETRRLASPLLRVRLKMIGLISGSCEAAREKLDVGEEDEGFGAGD